MPELSNAPKILIVDDDAVSRNVMKGLLEAEGFRTIAAADGHAARLLSRTALPDLILLDVVMPDESGFETCALLKSDPKTAGIPVIFLSALDDVKSKVKGLKIGGVDYISKPVYGEEVLARVRIHLRIRETDLAVEQEQRTRIEELRNAQQAILIRPEDRPEALFAIYYGPLEGVSGDFYDVVRVDSGVFGYFVADVSGHGVSAAFLTSAIKALLRQYTGPLFSPEDTLRGIDAVMRQMLGDEQYLTACYAHLNRRTKKLVVVSAGHPPVIVVSAAGLAQTLEMDSDPLGIFSALVIQRREIKVSPLDRFYLYTDGLIEASPGGKRAEGLERLVDSCLRHRKDLLADAVASIAADIWGAGAIVKDDLLLMAVEVPV
jgi:sigma-B regulation protein RsbU (phosphoserine phosphatase)